jgi:glycosyltransferase involved in cell wall biosynthesis
MRIAFISPNPFGFRGTSGTYKVIEKIKKYHEILVFCRPPCTESIYHCKEVPIIPIPNPRKRIDFQTLIPSLRSFDPDIVYIFNLAQWSLLLRTLRKICSRAKYVLDIRTPLLIEGEKRAEIQQAGNAEFTNLDAIIAHCKESVRTWIPHCKLDALEAPPGIDLSMFQPRCLDGVDGFCNRFVYVSSLYPIRKTEILIEGFASYWKEKNPEASLDIFGSGQHVTFLKELIRDLDLSQNVKLCGTVEQRLLLARLSDYDVGIAWVPKVFYNDAPSLKVLEFMAAGIAVAATDTNAHRGLLRRGFSLDLFDDNAESLAKALSELSRRGFSQDRILKNLKAINQFDYDVIVSQKIVPLLEDLLDYRVRKKHFPDENNRYYQATSSINTACSFSPFQHGPRSELQCQQRLRLVFLDLGDGLDGLVVSIAYEMAKRGHLVYIAYQSNVPRCYPFRHGIINLVYDRLDILASQIRGIDPDLFYMFNLNRKWDSFYFLVHETNIPLGIHSCKYFSDVFNDNSRCQEYQKSHSIWEFEVIASEATRILLTMGDSGFSMPRHIRPQLFTHDCKRLNEISLSDSALAHTREKTILCVNGLKCTQSLIILIQVFSQLSREVVGWKLQLIVNIPNDMEIEMMAALGLIEENNLQDSFIITRPTFHFPCHYGNAHSDDKISLSKEFPPRCREGLPTGSPNVVSDHAEIDNDVWDSTKSSMETIQTRVAEIKESLRAFILSSENRTSLLPGALEGCEVLRSRICFNRLEQLFVEAAEYKMDPGRLFSEQMTIDPERAMHARRMRKVFLQRLEK